MAARKDSRIKTHHREAIQTTMLIKRLTDHIDSPVLSQSQVRAAEILLRKSLPDLKSTELSGPDGGNIPTSIRIDFSGELPTQATEDTDDTE